MKILYYRIPGSKLDIQVSGACLANYYGFLELSLEYQTFDRAKKCLGIFLDTVETFTNPAESFAGMKLGVHLSSRYAMLYTISKNKESFNIFGYSEDHFAFLRKILRKVE